MRPISVTLGPYAAGVANGISTAQTLTAAGPFAINGSLAVNGGVLFDAPRQVGFTSAGNDSGIFFTVTGTSPQGAPLGETVRGTNAGVATTNNLFRTVYLISASGPTSSVTIGTLSAPWYSPMLRMDEWADAQIGFQVGVTGVVSYLVQTSWDEGPDSLVNPVPIASMNWDSSLTPAASAAAASFDMRVSPLWVRLQLASGAGSVRMVVTQYDAGA